MRSIEEVELRGKRVLLRADLNVPFHPGQSDVADDSRIQASLPTLRLLIERGARVVMCSHLGRPKGNIVPEMAIEPVRARLEQILGSAVHYGNGPIGDVSQEAANTLDDGEVLLLENLRFHPGEEANDPEFANSLAALADIYVNDAFGASHRSHASIVAITELLPSYPGLLMRDEITALTRALESDEHPSLAILGGAKVADKLSVLNNLAPNVDNILIGGGMVAAMFAAQGMKPGSVDISQAEFAAALGVLDNPRVASKLRLPIDVIVADEFSEQSAHREMSIGSDIQSGYILDIGPATRAMYSLLIASAKKIIWNGPMGLFEWAAFSTGTRTIGISVAANHDAFTLAGGGSTVEAITSMRLVGDLTHISTGGGASLEFLEGQTLPGIAALLDNDIAG